MERMIIQIENKNARVADIYRAEEDSVTLGRGFNNDIVVTDPYVAKNQLRIDTIGGKWTLFVLDDINPVLVNGSAVSNSEQTLNSGDTITIGRMHFRVFSEEVELEETRKLLLSNWIYQGRFKALMPILALLACCGLWALMEYQQLITRFKWGEFASSALTLAFVIISWAGLWALIGRLLRHQHHFAEQILFTAFSMAVLIILSFIPDYLLYATNSDTIGEIMNWLLLFAGLWVLLKYNLYLATNLKHSSLTAFFVCAIGILSLYGITEFEKEDFSTQASYPRVVKVPLAKLSSDKTMDEYMDEFNTLFIQNEESEE